MSAVRVRPARPADAAILATMANDLNEHAEVRILGVDGERLRALAADSERSLPS